MRGCCAGDGQLRFYRILRTIDMTDPELVAVSPGLAKAQPCCADAPAGVAPVLPRLGRKSK